MTEAETKSQVPLYVLLLGQGQEFDVLRTILVSHSSVEGVEHELSGHHAFGQIRRGRVNTIFIDPFSMWGGPDDATMVIFQVRLEFPEIVFVLFVNPEDFQAKGAELFSEGGHWSSYLATREPNFFTKERARLSHYLKLTKNVSDPQFGKEVDVVLAKCQQWHESIVNNRPGRRLYEYDVALSFAGEDRHYAEEIAEVLKAHGVRVFYDSYEQANLWGKDLYVHLHEVYSKKSHFCIMLVSSAYAQKMWTVHERRAAQERALKERENEYILPVRIDDTELPGLPSTIAYLDINYGGPLHICKLFISKLGGVLGTLS